MKFPFQQSVRLTLLALFAFAGSSTVFGQDSDLSATVKQIFRTRCFECHGDSQKAADIDILDLSTFVGEDGHVVPGSIDDSYLFDLIASDDDDTRMPEAPRPALTRAELESVKKWIEAGATEFPEDVAPPKDPGNDPALMNVVGAEYVLSRILEHSRSVPRDDRLYMRYFSSNHLLTSGATRAKLHETKLALSKAINHLSWQPDIVKPIVVDEGTETIFAVDIRDLGWHESPFTETTNRNVAASCDLYDLVLLEYPYGLGFNSSETYNELWDTYLNHAGLIRPVPYVRVDWFCSVATQAPLYEDLLQIPYDLEELESKIGVDAAGNMETYVAKRAGMSISGVSRNNRVVERHPALYGAYWKSYDFQTSVGQQNMFIDPINFSYAGGEMIWNLPNGLQAYLVTDTAGNRLLEAPTSIVVDKFSEDKIVRNGLACIRCHDRGMKDFSDNIRPAFEQLPDSLSVHKRDILRLYPKKETMDALLDKDRERFRVALEQALGEPQETVGPLVGTSLDFLDKALNLSTASAELGLKDPAGLEAIFRLPQFTRLGLAGLSTGNVMRRDSWEDYYDRIVRHLGVAVPIPAVDGLTRPDHFSDELAFGLAVTTTKSSNIYSPGDEMVITVKNTTGVDLFIEMTGTSTRGRKTILTDGLVSLKNGETFRFPQEGSIKIQPQLGDEFITVYANPKEYNPGVLMRGEGVGDRFVHDFFQYDRGEERITQAPTQLIRKTLKIQTR